MITTHFPPFHIGGDAVYVEYLSRELSKRGHEVHVAHNPAIYALIKGSGYDAGINQPDDGLIRHSYRSDGVELETLLALSLGINRRAFHWLLNLSRQIRPDVIHWHNSKGFVMRPLILANETSLMTSHDYTLVCPRSSLLRPGFRVCEKPELCTVCCMRWHSVPQLWRAGRSRRPIRLPTDIAVIAPSLFMKERLEQDGIRVSHLLRNFVPDPSTAVAGSDEVSGRLVYMGILERHKGVKTLVEAFCRSKNAHGFGLDIIGDGALRKEIEGMVKANKLESRIRIHGFLGRKEAEAIRSRAVAQIVPSEWYENSPLTVMEALAVGVPVIGAEIGGLPEIVGPESGCMTFPPGNASELSRAIISLWTSLDSLNHRRRLARKAYEERFSPKVHVSEYISIVNAQPGRDRDPGLR